MRYTRQNKLSTKEKGMMMMMMKSREKKKRQRTSSINLFYLHASVFCMKRQRAYTLPVIIFLE
jgi:hypothetical protein